MQQAILLGVVLTLGFAPAPVAKNQTVPSPPSRVEGILAKLRTGGVVRFKDGFELTADVSGKKLVNVRFKQRHANGTIESVGYAKEGEILEAARANEVRLVTRQAEVFGEDKSYLSWDERTMFLGWPATKP